MDIIIEKMLNNLEKNNIKPFYLETKEEVAGVVSQLLNEGDTVATGGSHSLFESGVIKLLENGRYNFLNRYAVPRENRRDIELKSMDADAYFCSCNAVTEAGELYNVDGNSNRISAIAFGPKSVIMIVGKNKIVKNLDEAVKRIRTVTAPELCKLRGRNTY
jgi:L-lactate utilization protein LutB